MSVGRLVGVNDPIALQRQQAFVFGLPKPFDFQTDVQARFGVLYLRREHLQLSLHFGQMVLVPGQGDAGQQLVAGVARCRECRPVLLTSRAEGVYRT